MEGRDRHAEVSACHSPVGGVQSPFQLQLEMGVYKRSQGLDLIQKLSGIIKTFRTRKSHRAGKPAIGWEMKARF